MSVPFICSTCGARYRAVGLHMKHADTPCTRPEAVMPRKMKGWPVQYPSNRQAVNRVFYVIDALRLDFIDTFGSQDADYCLDAPEMLLQGSCHARHMDGAIFSTPHLVPRGLA